MTWLEWCFIFGVPICNYPTMANCFLVDIFCLSSFVNVIELDDGKIYRKALYLIVKTMVSGVDFPNKTNPLSMIAFLECPLPSGKLTSLWKITIFNGKTHYKWQFSIAMLNYRRVPMKMVGFLRIPVHGAHWSDIFWWLPGKYVIEVTGVGYSLVKKKDSGKAGISRRKMSRK